MNHFKGNLLDSVTQGVILQQVNAQNAMGSGFAKAVYEKWPKVKTSFHAWSAAFPADVVRMGKVQPIQLDTDLWIVNIVGQRFAGRDGMRYTSYDALDEGLLSTAVWLRDHGFGSHDVHFPLIGAGLGGGHWPAIAALIEHRIGPATTLWTLPEA